MNRRNFFRYLLGGAASIYIPFSWGKLVAERFPPLSIEQAITMLDPEDTPFYQMLEKQNETSNRNLHSWLGDELHSSATYIKRAQKMEAKKARRSHRHRKTR